MVLNQMTALSYLNMSHNDNLRGNFLKATSKLQKLQALDLSHCSIPDIWLGNISMLTALQHLSLEKAQVHSQFTNAS